MNFFKKITNRFLNFPDNKIALNTFLRKICEQQFSIKAEIYVKSMNMLVQLSSVEMN